MAPRNSQEPNSRLTRLVCLPCQPSPAASAQRLFHQRRGVDEDLHLAAGPRLEAAGEHLQLALDQVVIVAMARHRPRSRRDPSRASALQRVAVRAVVHADHDDATAPPATAPAGRRGVGFRLEPRHRAVMAGGEELRETPARRPEWRPERRRRRRRSPRACSRRRGMPSPPPGRRSEVEVGVVGRRRACRAPDRREARGTTAATSPARTTPSPSRPLPMAPRQDSRPSTVRPRRQDRRASASPPASQFRRAAR